MLKLIEKIAVCHDFYVNQVDQLTNIMDKSNSGNVGVDGSKPKHKGEMVQSRQKGAQSVSNKGKGKHFKDNSGSEAIKEVDPDNTTKKQQNSV